MMRTKRVNKPKKKQKESKQKFSQSTDLFRLALSKILKLVVSQNNTDDVYALINMKSCVESINLSSKRAVHWLTILNFNEGDKQIHSPDLYRNTLSAIISYAKIGHADKSKVYYRVAFVNGTLYYDLVNSDWKFIKVNSREIKIISFNKTIPIFARKQSNVEQVKPIYDDNLALDQLTDLLRILDRQLFKIHLVTLLLEPIPVPIMVFEGQAGSMKTTISTAIKKLIDPSGNYNEDNCSYLPNNHDDLVIYLNNRYLSVFDNVTKINQETSDALCRAITGSSNSKRQLYTNSDESILNFRRKVVLNGIVPNLDYPDLQERMISYKRSPLQEGERLTEAEFNQKFNALLPKVNGQILQAMQKAIPIYNRIKSKLKPKTRMADFEVWGEAISRALGYKVNTFGPCYENIRKDNSLESIETYPIIGIVEKLMKDKQIYESSAQQTFLLLKSMAEEIGINVESKYVKFPKSVQNITKDLTVVAPTLKTLGIQFETTHYTKNDGRYNKNTSIITLTKIPSLDNYTS